MTLVVSSGFAELASNYDIALDIKSVKLSPDYKVPRTHQSNKWFILCNWNMIEFEVAGHCGCQHGSEPDNLLAFGQILEPLLFPDNYPVLGI